MKVSTFATLVCVANGVVCFAMGYFTANHRVTFDGPGPRVEEPAPAEKQPEVFKACGWTRTVYPAMGWGQTNFSVWQAPDGQRWVSAGRDPLTSWPAKP